MIAAHISAIGQIIAQNDGIEVEVKYGYYSGRNFNSTVPFVHFDRLRTELQRTTDRVSTEESHVSSDRNIRRIVIQGTDDEPETILWERKTRIKDYDIPEYDIRLSVNQEIPLEQAPTNFQEVTVRERSRTSYYLDNNLTKVDMTEVMMKGEDQVVRPRYEVEVEFLGTAADLPVFQDRVTEIFKQLKGTYRVFTNTQKNSLVQDASRAIGEKKGMIDKSVLVEARNIKRRDLVWGGIAGNIETGYRPNWRGRKTTLPRTNYIITHKADGLRKMLIIHRTGIWLVYPPFEFNLVLPRELNIPALTTLLDKFSGTILDGEWVQPKANNQIVHWYLAFDCLAIQGKNSIQQQPYSERSKIVAGLSKSIRTEALVVDAKQWAEITTPDSFFTLVKQFLDGRENLGFREDGLVFTPAQVPYNPGSQNLPLLERDLAVVPDVCKWKEGTDMTIDFALKWVGPEKLELHSYDASTGQTVPFAGDLINPFTSEMIDHTDPLTIGQPTGVVVEYEWTGAIMRPRRIRHDKTGPNRLEVAKDNWDFVMNPITEADITGISLQMAFSYHNRIKKGLFRLLPRGANILDIGSGFGGDVAKWKGLAVKDSETPSGLVVAVEPNDLNRAELTNRVRTFGMEDRVRIVGAGGEETDLITQNVQEFIPGGQVDAVALMLSMSFFWQSDAHLSALLKTIVRNLKPGGLIIFLTVNGDAISQLFEPVFSDVKRTDLNIGPAQFHLHPKSSPPYGRQLDIVIPETIVGKQTEFLVHLSDFTWRLQQAGIYLQEVSRAEHEKLLSRDNFLYSSLYSYGYYQAGEAPDEKLLPVQMGDVPVPGAVVQPTIPPIGQAVQPTIPPIGQHVQPTIPSGLPTIPPIGQLTVPIAQPAQPVVPVPSKFQLEHNQLPALFVSYTTKGGNIVNGPAANDDTYAPLTCTWYQNLVRIATIGEGSCFIHSMLKGYYASYQENNRAKDRLRMASELRRDLALKLGDYNPLYENRTYWETSGRGAFPRMAFQQVADETLVEELQLDYSLSGLQRLLNSNSFLGDEVYKFIGDAVNLDIYVLRATATDLYPHLHTRRPEVRRQGVVIIGNTYHYEVVAVNTDNGLQTVFDENDPFMLSMIEQFIGDGDFDDIVNTVPFDPDESFIESAADGFLGYANGKLGIDLVPGDALDQGFIQFTGFITEIFLENDPLTLSFFRLRDNIYRRAVETLTGQEFHIDYTKEQLDYVVQTLQQSGYPPDDIERLQAVVLERNDPQVNQSLQSIVSAAETDGLLSHDLVVDILNILAAQ